MNCPVCQSDKTHIERIVAAAISRGRCICFLPAPCRHHHVIHVMAQAGMKTPIGHARGDRQGFLTSAGRFVDRVEGRRIAVAAGQYLIHDSNHAEQLFSEDVW